MQLDDDELRRQCRVLFEGLYNPHHGLVEQRRKRLYELLSEHAELRKLTALEVDEKDDEQDEDDRVDEIYDEDDEALFQARGDASNNNPSFTPTHKKVKKSWSWKKVKKIATWPPKSRRVGKEKKKRLEEEDEQDLANSRGRQRER